MFEWRCFAMHILTLRGFVQTPRSKCTKLTVFLVRSRCGAFLASMAAFSNPLFEVEDFAQGALLPLVAVHLTGPATQECREGGHGRYRPGKPASLPCLKSGATVGLVGLASHPSNFSCITGFHSLLLFAGTSPLSLATFEHL
jgi:hypothetical protein